MSLLLFVLGCIAAMLCHGMTARKISLNTYDFS